MEIINNLIAKIYFFCKKHSEVFTVLGLGILLYFIIFHNIGTYPLMDVDETRYVAMSRDMFQTKNFLTLYLNGEYFFEKPPLYFWQECLSFAFWGKINEWTARFPVAMLGFIFSFVVYFALKSWVNKPFAIITSLIFATSLEFVMLTKYAILDIVLTFYIGMALICFFNIYFCKESHKKFFWWAFYLFSGLAVMAKGIPGVVVPFGIVFFVSIMTKKFKEIFKPIFFIPGMILFLLVILPWHILMLKTHDPLFFNEYIIKHHLHRFLNTENNEIGRKQPFYYYFMIVLWGFIPWIFSVISVFVNKCIHWKEQTCFKNIEKTIEKFNFYSLDNVHKVLALCWVSVIFIMLFFSSSSTKLATYILPIYFPLAVITGLMWNDYIFTKKHEVPINISAKVFGWICIIFGILAIFTPLFLPAQLNSDIAEVKWLVIACTEIFGIGTLISVKYKKYIYIFIFNVLFITFVSAFLTGNFFKIDYKFGQDDLVNFAKIAKQNDYTISAFGLSRKYSLLYYNDELVDYEQDGFNLTEIKNDLNRENNYVILKNKVIDQLQDDMNYEIVKTGRKYTMIQKKRKK